ncbi:MAG: hypothetical protein Q9Q40_04515 [Acidobacteriota bacterium]|nr:hypothetical protein [Acidobacteriota bacterium]MDQ7088110.1 hypothetical protein [Acidobacteriota bacterium]
MKRSLMILAATLPVTLALLTAGCNDDVLVDPGEQRIVVGITPTQVCPDPETQLGQATAVATIFADDGQVVGNAAVTFSSDSGGSFDPATAVTAEISGQATSVFSVERLDGRAIVVTGTLDATGESDTAELLVPGPTFARFARIVLVDPPQIDPPLVAPRSASLALEVSPSCNLAEMEFTLSWDPAIAALSTFPPGHAQEGEPYILTDSLFDQADFSTPEKETTLEVTSSPGQVHVRYYRSDTPQTGLTFGGARQYLILVFDGLAEGTADIRLDSLRLAPSFGPDYPLPADISVDPLVFVDRP